jgi:GT2 family glycosyltransferase
MTAGEVIDLSVILINWNSLEVTNGALASIAEHTRGIELEVFVVDNGSTKDESVLALPERFPWIRFVTNSVNLGFTRANNQGIRQALGRYVLLLNNDTVQTENALAAAVRYMDKRPEVGALGIMHCNNDASRSFQPSFFDFPQPWREVGTLLGLIAPRPSVAPEPAPPEKDVDWVCGSFLMMRRECLGQVGELDERFFIYDEDVDWCLRARRAGWKVRFWPGASMIHLGATSDPLMKDKTFTMFRSHLSYIRKHHGRATTVCFYLAMGARLMGATCKQGLRWLAGRAARHEFLQRWRRQVQFLCLKPGRAGG